MVIRQSLWANNPAHCHTPRERLFCTIPGSESASTSTPASGTGLARTDSVSGSCSAQGGILVTDTVDLCREPLLVDMICWRECFKNHSKSHINFKEMAAKLNTQALTTRTTAPELYDAMLVMTFIATTETRTVIIVAGKHDSAPPSRNNRSPKVATTALIH